MMSPEVLDNFWDLGNIHQTNRDKSCEIVASLDLQFLFPGTKVFQRAKTKELELKVYEFERSDYADDLAQPYGFAQQWETLAYALVIKFDDQQSLETWFAAINEVLNETTKGYFELVSRKKDGEVVESKILY